MGCQHLDDHYELFLLGMATDPAGDDIREHLENECAYCVEHLREAALSVYLLCLTLKPIRPDPKVKAQVLKRLRKK